MPDQPFDRDPSTRTDLARRVTMQLGDMARKGKVERIGKGWALRWRLASGMIRTKRRDQRQLAAARAGSVSSRPNE